MPRKSLEEEVPGTIPDLGWEVHDLALRCTFGFFGNNIFSFGSPGIRPVCKTGNQHGHNKGE